MTRSIGAACTSSGSQAGASQRSAALVRCQAGTARWGVTSAPVGGALDIGAVQAQARLKNRVIADLRSQKQQLTGAPLLTVVASTLYTV